MRCTGVCTRRWVPGASQGSFRSWSARTSSIRDLEASYAEMAAQEYRERDASEWADDLIADVADEAR